MVIKMFDRTKTKVINIGNVKIGGGNPIAVQSMTNTNTKDWKATVRQIKQLEEVGCEIVRVSVPDMESATYTNPTIHAPTKIQHLL